MIFSGFKGTSPSLTVTIGLRIGANFPVCSLNTAANTFGFSQYLTVHVAFGGPSGRHGRRRPGLAGSELKTDLQQPSHSRIQGLWQMDGKHLPQSYTKIVGKLFKLNKVQQN